MQCRGCCSPLTLSAVVTQEPSSTNHWFCFKVKYVLKTSQSFETISVTFQQSSPCSDSSWTSALSMWTQTISPQLIFRLFVVNIFSICYLTLLSTCFLAQFFPLLPPPKHKLKKHSIYAVVVNWCELAFYIATCLPTLGWNIQSPFHNLLFLSSISLIIF